MKIKPAANCSLTSSLKPCVLQARCTLQHDNNLIGYLKNSQSNSLINNFSSASSFGAITYSFNNAMRFVLIDKLTTLPCSYSTLTHEPYSDSHTQVSTSRERKIWQLNALTKPCQSSAHMKHVSKAMGMLATISVLIKKAKAEY